MFKAKAVLPMPRDSPSGIQGSGDPRVVRRSHASCAELDVRFAAGMLRLRGRGGLFLLVLPDELLHPPFRVNEPVLLGEERVALRAHLNPQGRLRGAGLHALPAGARYRALDVFRMYPFFHVLFLSRKHAITGSVSGTAPDSWASRRA